MKIILPVDENKKNVCISFGRAPFFAVYDEGNDKISYIVNPGADAQSGAGLKAAQTAVDSGADVLITVRCGENAAEVFKAAGMKIYKSELPGVTDNIKQFKENALSELTHFHAGFHGIK